VVNPSKDKSSADTYTVREPGTPNWKVWGRFDSLDDARAFADSIDPKRKWAQLVGESDKGSIVHYSRESSPNGDKSNG
jgi:hypothetical protein